MKYENERAVGTALKLLQKQTGKEHGYKFLKIEKKEGTCTFSSGLGTESEDLTLKISNEDTLYPEIYDALCFQHVDNEPDLLREGAATPGYTMRVDFLDKRPQEEKDKDPNIIGREVVVFRTDEQDTVAYNWSEKLIQDQNHSRNEAAKDKSI